MQHVILAWVINIINVYLVKMTEILINYGINLLDNALVYNNIQII